MFFFPSKQYNTSYFYPTSAPGYSGGVAYTPYQVPNGAKTLFIFCLGAGSGGGAGFSGASGTNRGGGGGGNGAAYSTMLIPTYFLPKTLMVAVAQGGLGGSAGNGGSGRLSGVYMAMGNNGQLVSCVLASGSSATGGGSIGTAGGGGAAGSGGAAAVSLTAPYSNWGVCGFTAGTAGTAGGGFGTSTSISGGNITTGGTGGGGSTSFNVNSAGGQIIISGDIIRPGLTASAAPGGIGRDGIQLFEPLSLCGGVGGASDSVGTGGKGGDGSYGCGGGGGGAGITGGAGGNGGGGLVIIIAQY